jgi:hypothetical protein
MDPNAAVDRLHEIVTEGGDPEEALEVLDGLRQWLVNGGFPPDPEHVLKLAEVTAKLVEDFWA